MPHRNNLLPLPERVWLRIDKRGSDECWPWTGTAQLRGYGLIVIGGGSRRRTLAHRVAYESMVGPIPEGLVLDHLCRNPRCCNPAHLEPVTQAENTRRGVSVVAENARKTHCKRGHEFTPENTYLYRSGGRMCRTCRRIYEQRRRPS